GCTLEVGSDLVSLEPDARRKDVAWPSGAGRDARVVCGSTDTKYEGSWGFFRLLNALSPRGSAAQWQLSIPGGGATMRVDFSGPKNPLTVRPTLGQFQCAPFTPTQ